MSRAGVQSQLAVDVLGVDLADTEGHAQRAAGRHADLHVGPDLETLAATPDRCAFATEQLAQPARVVVVQVDRRSTAGHSGINVIRLAAYGEHNGQFGRIAFKSLDADILSRPIATADVDHNLKTRAAVSLDSYLSDQVGDIQRIGADFLSYFEVGPCRKAEDDTQHQCGQNDRCDTPDAVRSVHDISSMWT
jgi:hypothetical protein